MSHIKVSLIIPCRNEEKFIANTLESVIKSDYPQEKLEIFVVDGMSEDKTATVVKEFAKKYPQVHLLQNLQKTVPYALNIGIEKASGEIIIRLDAHSIYPADYISTLVFWSQKLGCENVGGVWDTKPANDSLEARAVALCSSDGFGIGNAEYKVSNKKEPYEVDTVPFGCYKREVFEKIGLFDSDLTRNQDDEFNARLIQSGGKIFLIPTLKIEYFARENLKKMRQMFYQYGYFKPLVNLKLKKPATLRQFVPPLFVLFLFFGTMLSFVGTLFFCLFFSVLTLYVLLNAVVSYKIAKREKNLRLFPYLVEGFFFIHLSYGLGYLRGILDFVILKKHQKEDLSRVNISR